MAYIECPWCHEQAYAENDESCSNPHCQGPETYCVACGEPLVNAQCENSDCRKSPLYQEPVCQVPGCSGTIDENGNCTNEANHEKLTNNDDCIIINYYSNYATWAFDGALNREQVSSTNNVCVFQWIIDKNTSFPDNLHNYVSINGSGVSVALRRDGYEGIGNWIYYDPANDMGLETYIPQDEDFTSYEDVCKKFNVSDTGKHEIYLFAGWRRIAASYSNTFSVNFYVDGKPYTNVSKDLPTYSIWVTDTNYDNEVINELEYSGNFYREFYTEKELLYEVNVHSIELLDPGFIYIGKERFNGSIQPGDDTAIALHFISKKTISYNANGGGEAPDNQYGFDGDTIVIPEAVPIRAGYTFIGWGLTATADTALYMPGDTITIDRNLVLYAVWSPICCTINYYSNYATSAFEGALNPVSADTNVPVAQRTVYANQDFTNGVGLNKYTGQNADMLLEREGYKGTGYWSTLQNAEYDLSTALHQDEVANSYEEFCGYFGISTSEDTSLSLYPQWQKKQYCPDCGEELDDSGNCTKQDCPSKIKKYVLSTAYLVDGVHKADGDSNVCGFNFFNSDSDTAEPIYKNAFDINHEEPADTTFRFDVGAKNGYKYVGATVPDDVYVEENSETVLRGRYPARDFEVVFDFRSAKTITYNANGGSNAPAEQTTYYNVETNLSSAVPVRDGYTFVGWALDPNETESDNCYAPGAELTTAKDVTLYAAWREIVYGTIVYFTYADSAISENVTATYYSGQDFSVGVSLPVYVDVDSKEGYRPTGYWCTSADGTGKLIHQDTKFYSYAKLCEALGVSANANNVVQLYTQWKPLPAPGTSNVRIKTKNGWVVGQLKGKIPSGTATAVVVRVKTQNGWR